MANTYTQEQATKLLRDYEKLVIQYEAFIGENQKVLDRDAEFVNKIGAFKDQLKVAARENGELEGKNWIVSVTTKMKRFYDYTVLEGLLKPAERKAVMAEAIEVKVDSKKLDELVKGGKLRAEVLYADGVYREEEMTAAISFKTK